MTAEPLNVLVCYPMVRDIIDVPTFTERFPTARLLFEAYDITHEQLVARAERPSEAVPDELSGAQREAFGAAKVVVSLNIPLDVAEVAPRLRWVQGVGSGVGQFMASGIDGLVVTNAAGIGAPPIAEWVVAEVFAIYKRLPLHLEQQRRHHWELAMGSLVMGKRALIVGTGAIGTEVATRLSALGLRVAGVRRRFMAGDPLPPGVSEMYTPDRLLDAAAASDVVIAAVPGIPANADMFGEAFFAAMPAGSVFINVGRGSSVDEAALIATLQSGHLRGAAIDVAKHEPIPADDPLWDAPNLIVSPHSSPSGDGYMERLWDLFCDNLERYIAGTPMRNVVDMQAEYGRPA